ncbi:methyltransferase domain-containing protein [Candidatus Bathyarchaeota archaeon]|jgi:16S rRNA G966 N2-methylase RsmD|nr:methyltransferase domain-containing protein [Candidatus Bathyarchaeota archaeon]
MGYQIYFRISRGGMGIPYELAKTEFIAVFHRFDLEVKKELRARHRMCIELPLPPDKIAALAHNLGYTEAILHQRHEPYHGEVICPVRNERWLVGWIRVGEWKVYQTEVYVQNKESLLADAPNRRVFEIQQEGERRFVFGHHAHRAVSALDARFLYNIANPQPADAILDPFAGNGGLVIEAKRRGLRIAVSDIDEGLSPGLSALEPEAYFVADARCLPLCTNSFDLVVTEPSFRSPYRQAVMDSLTELGRVLKPKGRLILLIAMDMSHGIQTSFEKMGANVELIGVIPRGGGRKCPVLEITLL